METSPYDLLPVPLPLTDPNPPTTIDFYNTVVAPLSRDVIQMMNTGIPINLDNVSEVEDTVNNVLQKVKDNLENNELILNFLRSQNSKAVKAKQELLETKKRDASYYLKPYETKNSTHRSYVVNELLRSLNKEDMTMDSWSIKDIKKLNSIIDSKFLNDLLSNKLELYMKPIIDTAMNRLAEDKANAFNKNKIDNKKEEISNKDLIGKFNPGSPKQKTDFFSFYGIESESETSTGNAKFDRAELERILKLVDSMIEDLSEDKPITD